MRILAMFSAAFAAAAALCAYVLPAAWCWLPGLCLAALAAALLLLHGDPVRRVRTIALGLAAGFLWCWADAGRLVSVRALCGEGQTIEAEVCSLPERTQYGYRCVTLLQGNRMQLYLRNAPEDAALGDRVRVTADVTETGNSLYLASNDILLLGFARGEAEWEHPEQVSLRYAPQRALLTVQRTITNCFPADTAPLAIALVTGDTSGLPYALQTAMSDAGISHIVAVSGMHVTLLLGVVRLLCLRRRRLTAGVGIAGVQIRMELKGATAVGPFDGLQIRALIEFEDFVAFLDGELAGAASHRSYLRISALASQEGSWASRPSSRK